MCHAVVFQYIVQHIVLCCIDIIVLYIVVCCVVLYTNDIKMQGIVLRIVFMFVCFCVMFIYVILFFFICGYEFVCLFCIVFIFLLFFVVLYCCYVVV